MRKGHNNGIHNYLHGDFVITYCFNNTQVTYEKVPIHQEKVLSHTHNIYNLD